MDATAAGALLRTLRALQAQNAAEREMLSIAIAAVEPATDPRPALPQFANTFDSIPDDPEPAAPAPTSRRRSNGR